MRQAQPSHTVMWAVHYTEGPPVGADVVNPPMLGSLSCEPWRKAPFF